MFFFSTKVDVSLYEKLFTFYASLLILGIVLQPISPLYSITGQ